MSLFARSGGSVISRDVEVEKKLNERLDHIIDSVIRLGGRSIIEVLLSDFDGGEAKVLIDSSRIILVKQRGSSRFESVYCRVGHRLTGPDESGQLASLLLFSSDVYTVLKTGKSRMRLKY